MVHMYFDYIGGVCKGPLAAGAIVVVVPMKGLAQEVDAVKVVLEFKEYRVAAPLGFLVPGMTRVKTVVGCSVLGDPEMAGC